MTTLNDYMKTSMRLLREKKQDLVSPDELISFINVGRRDLAMRAQCIRVKTPISGAVITGSVIFPGSGYTGGALLEISPPDFPTGVLPFPGGDQAVGSPVVSSGTIASVSITYGGSGYFQPTASVTDTIGTGASVTLQVSPINVLNQNQEVYPFSDVDLTANPGVRAIHMVKGISIIYANYRYSLPVYAFSIYQARVRQYPFQYTYVPAIASQYGQGVDGSFYVYPLPNATYQYELDCLCIPDDLLNDQSFEALPDPWTDAIPYFACYYAMLSLQNFNAAKMYQQLYDEFALRCSTYARPGRMINPYGRY